MIDLILIGMSLGMIAFAAFFVLSFVLLGLITAAVNLYATMLQGFTVTRTSGYREQAA